LFRGKAELGELGSIHRNDKFQISNDK
jgi:hypothetical protein